MHGSKDWCDGERVKKFHFLSASKRGLYILPDLSTYEDHVQDALMLYVCAVSTAFLGWIHANPCFYSAILAWWQRKLTLDRQLSSSESIQYYCIHLPSLYERSNVLAVFQE
jgi:hypothetical protein